MKTKPIIILLCLSMIQVLPAAEEFKELEEVIVASNRPPIFGMLDGVKFENRRIDRVTSEYHVYVCHRERRSSDFKIGQHIDLETNRVRRVVANGERDNAVSTPWYDLKKIDPPKIINTPDKKD